MLELKGVSKYYHNDGITNKGLLNIDLKLARNEIVVITGESGSGKSTLLNVITKQDTFDDGEIYYLGNETSYFSVDDMDHFRKNKIGFIFQNYNIIDSYTVLENVMLPLIINDVPYKEAKKEAMEIIKKVGLEKWANNRGTKLSGGQKQRCVIARALASKCEILACDEPTGNLDSETGREIVNLIKEVAHNKLVLIVTHNYEQFKDIATRKIRVHDGEIIEDTFITKVEPEENKELVLDYVPVAKKTDLRIALNNLKSTPKKTLLMCLITLFTAFFAYYLYQSTYSLAKDLYTENNFIYQGSEKVILYNKDHSALDKAVLDKISFDSYDKNVFYGMEFIRDYFDSHVGLSGGFEGDFNYDKLEKISGEFPKNPLEIMFVMPEGHYYFDRTYENSFLTSKVVTVDGELAQFKIVGMAKSSLVSGFCFVPAKDDYLAKQIIRLSNLLKDQIKVNINTNSNSKTCIYDLDTQYQNIKYFDNDILNLSGNGQKAIPHEQSLLGYSYLEVGADFSDYENIYEVSLYGNKRSIIKQAKKYGLSYIDVSNYDSSTAAERFMNNLTTYISIFTESITVFLVYLVASVILSKIFSSKLETYAIFRTLGITKKDMKKVLYNEVFIIVGAVTVFNYLLCIFLGKLNIVHISKLFNNVSLVVSLLYFVVMAIIAWLLAKKFNKKLFKNSVRATLKEEK